MTPHKDPTKLPSDDQLKLLRKAVDDLQLDLSGIDVKLELTKNQVSILRTEVKDFRREIKGEIKTKFDKIIDRIDEFVGRIDDQDKNIAAATFRQEEHESRLSRLEKTVYVGSGA